MFCFCIRQGLLFSKEIIGKKEIKWQAKLFIPNHFFSPLPTTGLRLYNPEPMSQTRVLYITQKITLNPLLVREKNLGLSL